MVLVKSPIIPNSPEFEINSFPLLRVQRLLDHGYDNSAFSSLPWLHSRTTTSSVTILARTWALRMKRREWTLALAKLHGTKPRLLSKVTKRSQCKQKKQARSWKWRVSTSWWQMYISYIDFETRARAQCCYSARRQAILSFRRGRVWGRRGDPCAGRRCATAFRTNHCPHKSTEMDGRRERHAPNALRQGVRLTLLGPW